MVVHRRNFVNYVSLLTNDRQEDIDTFTQMGLWAQYFFNKMGRILGTCKLSTLGPNLHLVDCIVAIKFSNQTMARSYLFLI